MDSNATILNTSVLPVPVAGDAKRAQWNAERATARNYDALRSKSEPAISESVSEPTSIAAKFASMSDEAKIATISLPFHVTPRETQVAYWLIMGKTRGEIADILGGLNPHTVGDHIKALYRKSIDRGIKVTNKVEFAMMFAQYNPELTESTVPKYPREKFERLSYEQKYMLKLVVEGKTDPEIAALVNQELRPHKVKTATAVADFLKRFMERMRKGG